MNSSKIPTKECPLLRTQRKGRIARARPFSICLDAKFKLPIRSIAAKRSSLQAKESNISFKHQMLKRKYVNKSVLGSCTCLSSKIKETQMVDGKVSRLGPEVSGRRDPVICRCSCLYKLAEMKLLSRPSTAAKQSTGISTCKESPCSTIRAECNLTNFRSLGVQTEIEQMCESKKEKDYWTRYREVADKYVSKIFQPPYASVLESEGVERRRHFEKKKLILSKHNDRVKVNAKKLSLAKTKCITQQQARTNSLVLEKKSVLNKVVEFEKSLLTSSKKTPLFATISKKGDYEVKVNKVVNASLQRAELNSLGNTPRSILRPLNKKLNICIQLRDADFTQNSSSQEAEWLGSKYDPKELANNVDCLRVQQSASAGTAKPQKRAKYTPTLIVRRNRLQRNK
eukprot:TRINITY_DN2674_c0_g2_i7.p1 TRINITY_DN2674_c0_g2~~TRINITY_DN2674_c0_g2_i7.p1  ORF type:complete len:398 (+),score=37.21 TRINITY_DN2674_c0_g2_i7:112-1305(+)